MLAFLRCIYDIVMTTSHTPVSRLRSCCAEVRPDISQPLRIVSVCHDEVNAECKMQNAECKMQNAECEMQNAECGMQNAECEMRNAECVVKKIKATRLLICYPVFCKYKCTYSLVNAIDVFFKLMIPLMLLVKKRYR